MMCATRYLKLIVMGFYHFHTNRFPLSLDPEYCQVTDSRLTFFPTGVDKTGTKARPSHPITLFKHDELRSICPFRAVSALISRGKTERPHNDVLFYNHLGWERVADTQYIRGLLTKVMGYANVPNNFKAHSTRSASPSKASMYLSTAAILKAANWRHHKTFERFYKRSVEPDGVEQAQKKFQKSV